jgi:hypothetical protein
MEAEMTEEQRKIHDWMKPFIEEYGLHPETVRFLGQEGMAEEIMEALKREAKKVVELSRENALMKKALDRLLLSYKDGSIHDCLAMDLVKLVDAVTFCDQVRKTVK